MNAAVSNIEAIRRATGYFRGTQLVFSDMGVDPTPWEYSAYDELTQLVARGIPRDQIAAIGGRRHGREDPGALREGPKRDRPGADRLDSEDRGPGRMSNGDLSPFTTSTPMETGPAEVEQREGRILRQGKR